MNWLCRQTLLLPLTPIGLESILASFHAPFHCGAAWKYFCKRPLYKLYEIIFGRLVYRKEGETAKLFYYDSNWEL